MRKKLLKTGCIVGCVVFVNIVIFVLFAAYTNVPTGYSAKDKAILESQLHLGPFKNPKTFAQEILAIKTLQQRTFTIASKGSAIPDYEEREPADLVRLRKGLCFDRSRTIDKALNYIGLPSRHVYLLYRHGDRCFWSSLFFFSNTSHAVTEVKTSQGWLLVDSNTDWIALTRDGQVVNADDVWRRVTEFDTIPSYLNRPSWAIRGMYSRKGQLYPPYIFFPDLNWSDFINWLMFG